MTSQEEQQSRRAEKIANFKNAVGVAKRRTEHEHDCRLERYQCVDKHIEQVDHHEREAFVQRFADRERKNLLAKCRVATTDDFEALRVLGEGAFGVVHLVRRRGTDEYYALKQVKKSGCKKKNHRDGAFAERDLLAEAKSRWFVNLYATFQDTDNVYMVMEFLQGGDLIGYLIKKVKFTRKETQFYMAELLEALDTVHRCGFVHRDVKPDNMVLNSAGHLKLLDFGLCKHDPSIAADAMMEQAVWGDASKMPSKAPTKRTYLKSMVGTPQYMAPEVFRASSGIEADLWSLGIITFECLIGHVPFHANNLEGVEALRKIRDRVLRHSEILPKLLDKYVERKSIQHMSAQFLQSVLCERETRFTAEQCRRDPFFFGIDFATLHTMTPPIIPDVSGPDDAGNFDDFEPHTLPAPTAYHTKDTNLEWAHYEFNREAYELQRPTLDTDIFGTNTTAPMPDKWQRH